MPQPAEVVYDPDYGQRTQLKTYRDGSGWTGDQWPTGTTGSADVTTWSYHEPTGLLDTKQYHDGTSITYDYFNDGRLEKRTWERSEGGQPVDATYGYLTTTGELGTITYSDPIITPNVILSYRRSGLPKTVDDALGARTFAYDATSLALTHENLPGGGIYQSPITVQRGYDGNGKPASLQIGASYLAGYGYDAVTGRLNRVTGPGLPTGGASSHGAWYEYLADSNLIDRIDFKDGSGTRLLYAQRGYEPDRDIITSVANMKEGVPTPISRYGYERTPPDPLGRRLHADNSGSAFTMFSQEAHSEYSYNDGLELTAADRFENLLGQGGPAVGDETFDFAYDNASNRQTSTVDPGGANERQTTYDVSALNQYDRLDIYDGAGAHKAAQLIDHDEDGNRLQTNFVGDMNCDGYFNGGDITPFFLAVTDCGAYLLQYPNCDCMRADINGDGLVNGADIDAFFALLGGAEQGIPHLAYQWDGENRLIEVGPSAAPVDGDTKLTFAYDYAGRRVERKVWTHDGSGWTVTQHRKFVWAGWLMLLELNGLAADATVRQYTWGPDLSGSLSGAGGIGGLLATHDPALAKDYVYFYDANGNVGQLVEHDGTVAAHYEYTPYGGTQVAAGPYALSNPFRFSTKYLDTSDAGEGAETAWFYYFGYRYYDTRLGRWINRDPIGERGGLNLYGFVQNSPTQFVDPLGLYELAVSFDAKGRMLLMGRDNECESWVPLGYFSTECPGYVLIPALDNTLRQVSLTRIMQEAEKWVFDPDDLGEWSRWAAKHGGVEVGATPSRFETLARGLVMRHRMLAELQGKKPSEKEEAELLGGADAAAEQVSNLLWFYALAPLDVAQGVKGAGQAAILGANMRRVGQVRYCPSGAGSGGAARRLFRVVSTAEAVDIRVFVGFRLKPGGKTFGSGKFFVTSADDATEMVAQLNRLSGDRITHIVEVKNIPDELYRQFQSIHVSGEPVNRFVPIELLERLNKCGSIEIVPYKGP